MGAPGPSLRPALVVVAIAVVIVLGGAVLALVGTPSAHPAASSGGTTRVPGSSLRAEPARALLAHIASGGEPPSDVVSSLAVPAGSTYLGKSVEDRGVSQFDREVRVSVPAPERAVRGFYLRLLSEEHWTLDSITTPSTGSAQLIAERSGSDGYQWRVGIVLRGVATVVSPALAGGGSPARTTVSLQLYQVGDAS